MSDLMPRVSDALLGRADIELARRMPRSTQRAVNAEVGRGVVRAARAEADTYAASVRVEGAAYVTRKGLRQLVELSAEEGQGIQQAPLGEPRYQLVVDTFAGVVASEVAQLGYGR